MHKHYTTKGDACTCGRCIAWHQYAEDPELGECRRRAPCIEHQESVRGEVRLVAAWPMLWIGETCCEWMPEVQP